MSKKKINSNLYMTGKIKFDKTGLSLIKDPNGYLFAQRKYRTKILPSDLPEWYVYGYMYKHHGYISAKGIKQLIYVPNYSFRSHLHKDDSLFISYNDEITPYESDCGFKWYKGYDEVIGGGLIVTFIEAAKKYSGYDIGDIEREIAHKREFYYKNNPEEMR